MVIINGHTIKDLLNKKEFSKSSFYKNAKDTYIGVSLHTKGARPRFRSLENGNFITPPNYFGTDYQDYFNNFLFSRHPREGEVTRNWRLSQYKAKTKLPFTKITQLVSGFIYDQTRYFFDTKDKDLKDYLTSSNFNKFGFDFFQTFKHFILPVFFEDPNGFIFVKPIIKDGEKIQVDLKYINITKIKHYTSTDLIFECDNVIYHVNDTHIYTYINEVYKEYYYHGFGFMPCIILGGLWNSEGFFDSYFSKAIPVADDYVSSYSAEQMIDKENSHPYIQMARQECPTCHGEKGIQEDCSTCPDGKHLVPCKTCNGKGEISWSPMDRYEVPLEDAEKDFVKIINPDSNFNIYHHEKNIEIFQDILDALELTLVNQAQSGAAKAIDKENFKTFISNVSERLFALKEFCIKCITGYRNVKTQNEIIQPDFLHFTLIGPRTFNVMNEDELLVEIDKIFAINMPPTMRKEALINYIDKKYSGNELLLKKAKIILELDTLALLNDNEISSNSFSEQDINFHLNSDTILSEFITTQSEEKFLESDFNDLINQIKQIKNV